MSEPLRFIQLRDFLTDSEIILAAQLWRNIPKDSTFAKEVCEKIIKPNLPRINKQLYEQLGHREVEPIFFAYLVEYAVGAAFRVEENSQWQTP